MAYLFIAPHLSRTIVQQQGNERTASHELQTRRIRVEGFTPQMFWGLNCTVTLLLLLGITSDNVETKRGRGRLTSLRRRFLGLHTQSIIALQHAHVPGSPQMTQGRQGEPLAKFLTHTHTQSPDLKSLSQASWSHLTFCSSCAGATFPPTSWWRGYRWDLSLLPVNISAGDNPGEHSDVGTRSGKA